MLNVSCLVQGYLSICEAKLKIVFIKRKFIITNVNIQLYIKNIIPLIFVTLVKVIMRMRKVHILPRRRMWCDHAPQPPDLATPQNPSPALSPSQDRSQKGLEITHRHRKLTTIVVMMEEDKIDRQGLLFFKIRKV